MKTLQKNFGEQYEKKKEEKEQLELWKVENQF